jgi:phospholipase C
MKKIVQNRRNFLRAIGGLAATAGLGAQSWAAEGTPDLQGLRQKIDHVVVIYQENRSFDHYFGTYRSPHGGRRVNNLLNAKGLVDERFTGLQRNPEGIPYNYLPVPAEVPGFYNATLENRPFHLAPYIPADDNVPWDPSHNFHRMYAQVDSGRMDQFVALALKNPLASPATPDMLKDQDAAKIAFELSKPSGAVLGYYERTDIPHYHALADDYVLFDNFFQAMSGGSTGNALYLVAGRSAQWLEAPDKLKISQMLNLTDPAYDGKGILINDLPPLQGPTETSYSALKIAPPVEEQNYPNVGDTMTAAGISWAWYNENWNSVKPWALKTAFGAGDGSAVIDTPNLYVPHHNPFQYYPSWNDNVRAGRMRDAEDFAQDLKSGKLPQVSFIKATAIHDEHPAESAPQWGESWVMALLKELANSPAWSRTAVIITYDEGGGFWDHVAPPQPDEYGCGTRIPAFIISAYARRGYVDHKFGDTTSVLSFINARFGLKPLGPRVGQAYNMLDGLDFSQPLRTPSFG